MSGSKKNYGECHLNKLGGARKKSQGVQEKNYRGCTNFRGGARQKKIRRALRASKILHPLAKCL